MIDRKSPREVLIGWSEHEKVPQWVERWGPRVLVAGSTVLLVTTGIWVLAYSHQVDLSIYRFGGQAALHGSPLYDHGLTGQPHELMFNYPPFAAVCLAPLALLPLTLLRLLVPIGNFALLLFVIRRCWQSLGIRDGGWELRSLTML